MNYRRGLFRVWIILSVIWSVVFFIVALYIRYRIGGDWWRYQWWISSHWTDWLAVILAPWVLTGAALLLRWTVRGFRSN
jgi:hypothetical protein